jgi:purine-nucleoside phosphorylase
MPIQDSWLRFSTSCEFSPAAIALVLGSGMGAVVDRWRHLLSVPFGDVPGLVGASVHGHRGQFSLVELGGKRILVQEGRLHCYEGHSWERVLTPTAVLASLGVKILLHTNAAGGIHEALLPGCLMAIRDHLICSDPGWWRAPVPCSSP